MHNDMSYIPHNKAPPTASPLQFSNYAEADPNSWIEPAGPRPPTMATPYGMSLPMQSSTFPANKFYSVVDELFDMQMPYDHPDGDPMVQFSQNFFGFGNPNLVSPMLNPENRVTNATNAGMISHSGQNPTANAEMMFGNSEIPTNVNPFDREENVFYGSDGGVYNIGNSRDAAHQLFEESPAPHNAVQVVTPAPLNPITSSSSAAAAEDLSGYNYLSQDDPSSKGFDGHTHTAKKD